MECPVSYHVSCIPPPARFHELAILCHEHSSGGKLPDLDEGSSLQCMVEETIDDRFVKKARVQRRRWADRARFGRNPFFQGVVGGKPTVPEKSLLNSVLSTMNDEGLDEDGEDGHDVLIDGRLMFCLPCELKEEVHSKPPSYRHVRCLQYNPRNRPPPVLPSLGDVCECVGSCDDSCFNRVTYVECYGGGTAPCPIGTNCSLGVNCGNRQLGLRKSKKCRPEREQGKGWGLVACEEVKKGELVQEYIGEVIDEATKRLRLDEWTRDHPNDPNFYVMALGQGWFIDARVEANLSRFINHSCDPNCILSAFNVGGYMRNGIFALRDLEQGEFLSYDYHFDTNQGDRFVCRCGSKNCRGTMKDRNTAGDDVKRSKSEQWEEAKVKYEREKKFLAEHYEDEQRRSSQVDVIVPGADHNDETVASGLQVCGRVILFLVTGS
jgi:SET domain